MSSDRKLPPDGKSRETKASLPPPSKPRPGHLSNLPKSTAAIESPGHSPEFPGAFPRENLPRNPFRSPSNAYRAGTMPLGRPLTLLREASQISDSSASFYSTTSRQSFTSPAELFNEDINAFSSTNRAENESKRGRDPLEGEGEMSNKKKMRKNDGGGEDVKHAQPTKSLALQSSEAQLAAKESEVIELRKELTDVNSQHSVAQLAILDLKSQVQRMRNQMDELEVKLEANQEVYKKVIAQILHHIDQRSGPGNWKFDPHGTSQREGTEGDHTVEHADALRQTTSQTTSQTLDVALAHSKNHAKAPLRDYELEEMSQTQVIAEVLQYAIADMPQSEAHKRSGSTSAGIQGAKSKIIEAEITQKVEEVVDSEMSEKPSTYSLESSAINNSLERARKIREAALRKLSTSEHRNHSHRDQEVEKQAPKDEATASDTAARDEEVKQRRKLVSGDDEDVKFVEELVVPEDLEAGGRRDRRRNARFDMRKKFIVDTIEYFNQEGYRADESDFAFWGCVDSVMDDYGPDGMSSDESTFDGEEEILVVHRLPHREHADMVMDSIDQEMEAAGMFMEGDELGLGRKRIRLEKVSIRPPFEGRPRNLYDPDWATEKGPNEMEKLEPTDASAGWDSIVAVFRKEQQELD